MSLLHVKRISKVLKLIAIMIFMSLNVFATGSEQKTQATPDKKSKKKALISKQIQLIKVIAKSRATKNSKKVSAN